MSIEDESIHLIVTSPPYWNIKYYSADKAQLGNLSEYDNFCMQLKDAWEECFRVLIPGGKLVVNIGDILLSRKKHGRHRVLALHADVISQCCRLGFDYLSPIIWNKIGNASHEIERGAPILGKPFEPNAIIKNNIEYILIFRKPGPYRKPTAKQRKGSKFTKKDFFTCFRQIWTDVSGTHRADHPAPFPEALADRLIRMNSFVGDRVLDPFCGSGTTVVAAMQADRQGIGIDISKQFVRVSVNRCMKRKFDVIELDE